MWLFEQHGFMSVVAYDPSKDRNKASQFSTIAQQAGTHLLVRARIKEDLDVLKTVLPTLVVEEDPNADYSFRCVIPRAKFKEFLVKAVDDIDYDSHFKEVASANSPKVEGRHSAMMKCWSAMIELQPIKPWGGYSGGYYSGGYGGLWDGDYGWSGGGSGSKSTAPGKSGSKAGKKSSGKAGSPGIATGSTATYGKEGTADDKRGYETVEDFKQAFLDGELVDFRLGEGPRTGFKVGDEVEGYFGPYGKVLDVQSRPEGVDKVQVKVQKGNVTTTGWYMSNFLMPMGLPDPSSVEEDIGLYETMDDMYSWLMEHERKPDHFPPERIGRLDEECWEFLTRIQEHLGQDETIVSVEDMNRIYDEVRWEKADTETRLTLIADDKVPEKHKDEALRLPIFSEK